MATSTVSKITGLTVAASSSALSSGSVLFADSGGNIAEDNAQLFWDDTNNRLGIGTASPATRLHVIQSSDNAVGGFRIRRTTDSAGMSMYVAAGIGSLNDPLIFSSTISGDVAAIGRDGSGYFAGSVGISTSSPAHSSKLDVAFGGMTLVMGADTDATTRTNSTRKNFKIGAYHYTNAQAPIGALYVDSSTSANEVNIGGGTSSLTAATVISFFTAANTTTTSGTERARIDSAGNVGIGGTANANAILDVQSTTKAFMPPRMTSTQRDNIASPTAGMVIYNSTTNKLNVYTTTWEAVTSA